MTLPTLQVSAGYAGFSPGLRDQVRQLQRLLARAGLHVRVDGQFGPVTREAVERFQRLHGLMADGRVGPLTWRALEQAPESATRGGPRSAAVFSASSTPPSAAASSGRILPVTWISQWTLAHPKVACYRACIAMAATAGTRVPPATTDRIQVALSEDQVGHVSTTTAQVTQALTYVDTELSSGRPVVAGVSYTARESHNRDAITDHFVLIVGKTSEGYVFHDPGPYPQHEGNGRAQTFSRDSATGNLTTVRPNGHRYEMSMIVRNARN